MTLFHKCCHSRESGNLSSGFYQEISGRKKKRNRRSASGPPYSCAGSPCRSLGGAQAGYPAIYFRSINVCAYVDGPPPPPRPSRGEVEAAYSKTEYMFVGNRCVGRKYDTICPFLSSSGLPARPKLRQLAEAAAGPEDPGFGASGFQLEFIPYLIRDWNDNGAYYPQNHCTIGEF
jgi:hypothetical protein